MTAAWAELRDDVSQRVDLVLLAEYNAGVKKVVEYNRSRPQRERRKELRW